MELHCVNETLEELCGFACEIHDDHDHHDEESDDDNLGLAFILVAAAALSTGIGGAMVFFKDFHLQNFTLLGAALGFSSGIMLFVSFVEIYQESLSSFQSCDCLWGGDDQDSAAEIMTIICFFAGIALTRCLDFIVHWLLPSNQAPGLHAVLSQLEEDKEDPEIRVESGDTSLNLKSLETVGLKTALAIGLHNFPEGLATFTATLVDPSVGVALAVAIGIHNIPEGLCVAVPIYYATDSKLRGFWYACISGFMEFMGALLGYAFLEALLGDAVFAVMLGVVAGMMVSIVLIELLPTAHRFDKQDKYVSKSVVFGAMVMATSIALFSTSGGHDD